MIYLRQNFHADPVSFSRGKSQIQQKMSHLTTLKNPSKNSLIWMWTTCKI